MSTDLPGLGSNRMQAMVYGYDQLHRIVQARSLTEYGTAGFEERVDAAMPYDVDYSYDPNGNLLTLKRLDGNTSLQDDLTYEYNEGTNRLRNTDPADGENYTYDKIGNLISDAEEGIDSISWTPYGKVRKVEKADNSSVSFRYDASGNRIAKIADGDTTVYVRDASGNVMGVYKNDTLVEQSIYGSSRLGLMTSASKTGYRTLGGKKYELSNHLGNVMGVVTDNIYLDQDSTWANVVNTTDYYPFGLSMDGRTQQDSAYRYGFNGKERDDKGEWGQTHYDYGFRIYNPSIAKFLSVDPLAANYPYFTPYQFAGNKPIMFIDLDGAEFQIPTFEKFKYGNNAAMNVVTVVDNVAINAVNGSITLVNSGIYTVHKVFTDPTSIPEELKSDLGAMAAETEKYFRNQYDYVANTPISRQLSEGVETLKSPESYEGPAELATALFLTKNIKTSGRSASVTASEASKRVDDLVGFRKDHILNRHRPGAGKPGKTEFPTSWSDTKIIDEVNNIANDTKAPGGIGKWDSPYKIGSVDGIEIRVDFYPSRHPDHAGKVSTAYPTKTTPNPKK